MNVCSINFSYAYHFSLDSKLSERSVLNSFISLAHYLIKRYSEIFLVTFIIKYDFLLAIRCHDNFSEGLGICNAVQTWKYMLKLYACGGRINGKLCDINRSSSNFSVDKNSLKNILYLRFLGLTIPIEEDWRHPGI